MTAQWQTLLKLLYNTSAGVEALRVRADQYEEAGDQETADGMRKEADRIEIILEEGSNRIKELPAERQGWSYYGNGYADESDYEDDGKEVSDPNKDWSQPLIRIHTSDQKDYLAENNLTELYGWTTHFTPDDQYLGEGDFVIWVRQGGGLHAIEVTGVELFNVKEGMENERRTVYRLTYSEGFSTCGSPEEAAADLNANFGKVLTEEEAGAAIVEAYLNNPLEVPTSAPSNPFNYSVYAKTTTRAVEVVVSAYMKARDILNKREGEEGDKP